MNLRKEIQSQLDAYIGKPASLEKRNLLVDELVKIAEKHKFVTGEPHKALDQWEVYNYLRYAHQTIKDLVYAENYEEWSEELKNAVDSVHKTLYMAEYITASEEENKKPKVIDA